VALLRQKPMESLNLKEVPALIVVVERRKLAVQDQTEQTVNLTLAERKERRAVVAGDGAERRHPARR